MAYYGNARVSSTDEDYTLQEQALRAVGCDVVRSEKASGKSRMGRTELETLLDFLRNGDTLVAVIVSTRKCNSSTPGYLQAQTQLM